MNSNTTKVRDLSEEVNSLRALVEKQGKTISSLTKVKDDISKNNKRLLSHVELSEKFNLPWTFLEALSIWTSIPRIWRGCISANWQPDREDDGVIELKLDKDPLEKVSILSA